MYVVELYPDKGFSSLVNLSFELYGLSLDGINSEGLTVTHLYADSVNSDLYQLTRGYGVGINEMLVVQLLLDKCKTVDEAKDVLLSNKHFYLLLPTHLLIADRFGKSFVWEYSPQHNCEYIIDGGDQPQVITNFLLHEFKSSDEFPESKEKACPFSRYKSIEDDMACDSIFSIEKIKEINSRVFISDDMFHKKPDPKERTIYHSLYDTNKRSMEISFYRKDEGKKELRTRYFEFQLT
jgi:predicted choloylglycine hydrolase